MAESEHVAEARRALGRKLAAYRRAAGLNQVTLAPLTSYGRSTIANVEIGRQNADRSFWERADKALHADGILLAEFDQLTAMTRAAHRDVIAMSGGRYRTVTAASPPDTQVGDAMKQFLCASRDDPPRGSRQSGAAILPSTVPGSLNTILATHAVPSGAAAVTDDIRRLVDEALDDGSDLLGRVARLQRNVRNHARAALREAPLEMLGRLSLDLVDAKELVGHLSHPGERSDVRAVIAGLAALTADEINVLGDTNRARAWYSTAIAAADSSGQALLRADVRSLAAMLPLYHGSIDDAIDLAGEASNLAGTSACVASGLAPMLEGLAWARTGNADRARESLDLARRRYELLPEDLQAESVFGFSPRRLLFYEGRLLTQVGAYEAAQRAHSQALVLYPEHVVGDRTLILLDRALALAHTGHAEESANLVSTSIQALPAAHLGLIFLNAAQAALDAVDPAARPLPLVRDSRECVAELWRGLSRLG